MKIVIILLLAGIIVSLLSGAVFLFRDRNGERTVRALTLRIGLSVVLFLLLLLGFQSGLLQSRVPV